MSPMGFRWAKPESVFRLLRYGPTLVAAVQKCTQFEPFRRILIALKGAVASKATPTPSVGRINRPALARLDPNLMPVCVIKNRPHEIRCKP
jgi:hypothetical protein